MDHYEYTDPGGQRLTAAVTQYAGELVLAIETDQFGVMVPLDGIDEYLTAMQALVHTARERTGVPGCTSCSGRAGVGPQPAAQSPAGGTR